MNELTSIMSKFKKKFLIFLAILIVFLSGLLTERFQIDNKFQNYLENSYDKLSRFIYGFFSQKEIYISLEPKEFQKIVNIREKALERSKLTKDLEKWSDGNMIFEKQLSDIQIRLKGVFPDHWSDSSQWSFKVKIDNNSVPINGIKRFALQPPKTTSYIYEWLFMKALEKEKLFSLGAELINLKINENNLGAYMLIGQISDSTILKNKKEISPIIGFDSELWIKEQIQSNILNAKGVIKKENGTEDAYYRVKINPIQFKKNDENLEDLKQAINILESFRQGRLKTSEAFNIDHLAKIMAIRALLGSYQFDWLDTKFYYNKETNLLEPISKEIHVDLDHNYKVHYPSWWIDSYVNRPDYEKKRNFFIHDIFKDEVFYEKYLKQLNEYTEKNFIKKIIDENKKEFNKYLKMLKMNYPTKKVFSEEHLEITRLRIQNYLNPVQNINAYFQEFKNGVLSVNISNLQRLPVKIIGLQFKDGTLMKAEKNTTLFGRKPFLPVKHRDIKFNCKTNNSCKRSKIENQKIIFRILGQESINFSPISPYYK